MLIDLLRAILRPPFLSSAFYRGQIKVRESERGC